MEKTLKELLSALKENALEYTFTAEDGTPLSKDGIARVKAQVSISSLEFDSRHVAQGSLFFALPGTHTTGNRFIAQAIKSGAVAVVYEGEFSKEDGEAIAQETRLALSGGRPVAFLRVKSSRFAMSPLSAAFYENPSEHLVVYGVTGTEGKSSTVAFIWQLLRLNGIKAGFISTVQYSLGGEAIANPEHQTTPEAPIVQRELYEMLCNGCTHAVVEASSHGLSERTNRLGDVHFDVAAFMNVTLEHLEFHGTLEQYKNDKANLFRALDKWSHEKVITNALPDSAPGSAATAPGSAATAPGSAATAPGSAATAPRTENPARHADPSATHAGNPTVAPCARTVPSFGVVNLEDPAAAYFAAATNKKVMGFTTEGKAGKHAAEELSAPPLPPIPADMAYLSARSIASARFGLTFSIHRFETHDSLAGENRVLHVKAPLPGAFNAYNIMAALIAVHGTTGIPLETLAASVEHLTPVKGRMTVVDRGQPFEVIVDYAHTPSSFETIFPPVKKRCAGRMIALFGSGGERDVTKRPLQGEIAARFCDIVILTDEDPRGEDSTALLEQIAGNGEHGALSQGKVSGESLFIIPDRPTAIRKAFSIARENDIVLLLGKSHENSIIYKDRTMPYDEISEANKALKEMGF